MGGLGFTLYFPDNSVLNDLRERVDTPCPSRSRPIVQLGIIDLAESVHGHDGNVTFRSAQPGVIGNALQR